MEVEQPNYYAIIPASVRYDNRLKANEKLLYSEITALSNKTGICYATNKYFAELYEVDNMTISRWIKHLRKLDYIDVEILYKNDTKEVEKRLIKINGVPIDQKVGTYIPKNLEGYRQNNLEGIDQKVYVNNTSINNTRMNNKNNISKEILKSTYFEDIELNEIFNDFLKLRKELKAKNTERAINNLLNKLNKYDDEIKKQMINNSITNSWKDVYELKNKSNTSKSEVKYETV